MATVLVKHSASLPISFVQYDGDHADIQCALESKLEQKRVEGALTTAFLRVMGRHWDTVSKVAPESPTNVAGGVRVWNKATGLPLMRALTETAYGQPLDKSEHDAFAPYYTTLATGLFFSVSPFHPEEERLRTWKEYKEAIGELKAPEPGWKAILRGLDTIVRKSGGNLYIPSVEACHAAAAQADKVQAQAVVQILRHMLGEEALYEAIEAANEEAKEYALISANQVYETAE